MQKKYLQVVFLVLESTTASNHDVGMARGIVFQEIRPGAGWFQNQRFRSKKSWGGGGGTVERVLLFLSILSFFL